MKQKLFAVAAIAAVASAAQAASYNVDFSDGLGTPSASFGALGDAGTWNVIPFGQTSGSVADTTGSTTASISLNNNNQASVSVPDTDYNRLMGDWAEFGSGGGAITFTGLENGSYSVYTYGGHGGLTFTSADVTVLGASEGAQTVMYDSNQSYDAGIIDVTDGSLTINIGNVDGPFAGINGVQLVGEIPAPSSAAALALGGLTIARRRRR